MTWGAGEGWTLPARHGAVVIGSRMVMTAPLLGEVAGIPGCRLDGGVGGARQRKVAVPERGKMAGAAETTVSSLFAEVVSGRGPVETRVLLTVESSG